MISCSHSRSVARRETRSASAACHAQSSRRQVLTALTTISLTAIAMPSSPAHAARLDLPNKEADDATSPYIQELLKRTAEKKDERKKERLQDYYRRNFKDYFEFEAGSRQAGEARGISQGTQDSIRKWLEDNN